MANTNIFLLLIFWMINIAISQNTDSDRVDLILINGFDSSTVRQGESLQLRCTKFGSAVGGFHWELVQGTSSTILTEGGRISIALGVLSPGGQLKSTLTISNAELGDEGLYRCVFLVDQGGNIDSSVDVKVAHHPAPQCFKGHEPIIGLPGSTTLLCTSAPASPNITIQWEDLVTGNIVNGNESFSEVDGLFLNTLSSSEIPEGNITRMQCVVKNPAFPGVQKTCDYIERESITTMRPTSAKISPSTKVATTEAATSSKITNKITESSSPLLTTIKSVTLPKTTETKSNTSFPITTENKLTYASNVTEGLLPNTGAIFGMTEIILIAAIGGVIVLILIILFIFIIVKCCCSQNKDNRDLGVGYRSDGDVVTEIPLSNGYVKDDLNAPEYPVMDNFHQMESGDLSKAPSVDDLNVLSTLSAIKDAKKEEKQLNVSIGSSHLYDSVCIDDDDD